MVMEKQEKKPRHPAGLSAGSIVRFQLHIQLRHQLVADDRQHLLQLVHILGGETVPHALHHGVQVRVADVVIFDILLGRAEVVFAPILGCLLYTSPSPRD